MIEIVLNRPEEKERVVTQIDLYKPFLGRIIDTMPQLLAEDRTSMSYADVMNRWLDVLNTEGTPDNVRDSWVLNYIDTGDGARRNTDGGMKYAHNSATLRTLTPESTLSRGALILTPDEYTAGDGPEFTQSQVDKYTEKRHDSPRAVVDNPIWLEGPADGDATLLREFAQAVFTLGKEQFRYDEAMRIWAPEVQNQPIERLWYAGSLGDDNRGGADGDNDLSSYGRLVGVAPKAQITGGGATAPNINTLTNILYTHLAARSATDGITKKSIREGLRAAHRD